MQDIKLICFDMDDTLVNQNSWYKLNLALGVTHEEDKQMYDAYMDGSLSYEDWTVALLDLYKKHGKASRSYVTEVLSEYELCEGAKESVTYLKQKGYELAIISGSFDTLVDLVADELGVSHRKGNTTLVFGGDDMLIDIKTHGDETVAKLRHLEEFCKQLNIPITQSACIGDGANDLEMFSRTGHGITFSNSPAKGEAWKTIDTLRDIKGIF